MKTLFMDEVCAYSSPLGEPASKLLEMAVLHSTNPVLLQEIWDRLKPEAEGGLSPSQTRVFLQISKLLVYNQHTPARVIEEAPRYGVAYALQRRDVIWAVNASLNRIMDSPIWQQSETPDSLVEFISEDQAPLVISWLSANVGLHAAEAVSNAMVKTMRLPNDLMSELGRCGLVTLSPETVLRSSILDNNPALQRIALGLDEDESHPLFNAIPNLHNSVYVTYRDYVQKFTEDVQESYYTANPKELLNLCYYERTVYQKDWCLRTILRIINAADAFGDPERIRDYQFTMVTAFIENSSKDEVLLNQAWQELKKTSVIRDSGHFKALLESPNMTAERCQDVPDSWGAFGFSYRGAEILDWAMRNTNISWDTIGRWVEQHGSLKLGRGRKRNYTISSYISMLYLILDNPSRSEGQALIEAIFKRLRREFTEVTLVKIINDPRVSPNVLKALKRHPSTLVKQAVQQRVSQRS